MNKSEHPYAEFISAAQIQRQYAVSSSILRRWDAERIIRTVRTPGNFRLYSSTDVHRMFGRQEEEEEEGEARQQQEKTKFIYARVSSNHQKEDLQRQIQDLQAAYPGHELIQDIGSGLNYHRKGFQRLLERVHEGTVDEVVVTHKDRLCRYGVELLEWLFTKTGTKLVVHCRDYQEVDPSRELADDLLAVCNFFVARNNGRRASDNRKRRKRIEAERRQEEEEGQAARRQGQEDQVVSNEEADADFEQLVQDSQVDL